MSTTESLDGWIDDRRRPLVNVRVWRDRTICALVDTGFNGYLLWESSSQDLADFPGELSSLYESVEVAGTTVLVALAVTDLHWLGDEEEVFTRVEVLVPMSPKTRHPGDPVALIGTALLSGTILTIDFLEDTLRIRRSR